METEPQSAPPVEEEVVGADQAPATEPEAAAEPQAGDGSEPGPEPQAAEPDQPDYLALAQRLQADFDNFRKRAQRDQAAAERRGVLKVVKEILPALDDLERALTHVPAEQAEGLRLLQSSLTTGLTRVGVTGYSPKGEAFDPNVHEAMAQQPVEGAEPGTVVEVYQQGWRTDDVVIRPARVVVAA